MNHGCGNLIKDIYYLHIATRLLFVANPLCSFGHLVAPALRLRNEWFGI